MKHSVKISRLTSESRTNSELQWDPESVLAKLGEMSSGPELSTISLYMEGELQSSFFRVNNVEGRGYYITCAEAQDTLERELYDPSLGQEMLDLEIEGVEDRRPTEVVVGVELARRALAVYMAEGRRAPDLCWRRAGWNPGWEAFAEKE